MRITKLQRSPEGYWEANVSRAGKTLHVDRRYGVWGTPPDEDGRWNAVKVHVAAVLQDKVRPREKAERRVTV